MRIDVRRVFALALLTLAFAGGVVAQDFSHKVRADVPFNFYAGNKLMPAGTYTFSISVETYNVAIRPDAKGTGRFVLGVPNDGSHNGISSLTFRTDGQGGYILQKVRGPDYGVTFHVDKAVADLAQQRPADATLTVLAQMIK